MSHVPFSRTVLALAILATAPSSQVPPGDAALFRTLFSTGEPLQVLDVEAGLVSTVVLTPPQLSGGAGAIDPATGILYSSSLGSTALSYELDGVAGAAADVFGEIEGTGVIISVALDGNGDLIGLSNAEQLWRLERASGDATLLADLPAADTGRIEVDPVGDRLWLVSSPATILRLYEYDLGDPALEPTLLVESPSGFIGGLAYDASREVLYLCTSGNNGRLMHYDLDEGQLVYYDEDTLPDNTFFTLDYDRSRDLVHLIGSEAGVPARHYTFDPRTLDLELLSADAGAESARVYVNDFLDSTTVYPLRPQAGEAFTLEVAAHGEAGEFGAVFAVTINGAPIAPLLLASGPCDSGGISSASHPVPGILSAGDRVGFVAVRLSADLGNFVVAPPAVLEAQ